MAGRATKGDLIATMQNIRRGAFVELANEQLGELVQACFATEEGGEIQITLKVKPNSDGQVKITPICKIKKPVRGVGEAIFYATVDGSLERTDPKQSNMFDDESQGGGGRNNN
jgi:hypothetical protein